MAYWNTRGLRGSTFEEMINLSNEVYSAKNLAIIQKIPTPITPISIDKSKNAITLGYFEKKSTVDYVGAVQGIPVCFDAKETNRKSLPLQNIHPHQMDFMRKFQHQNGVSFFLVRFALFDEIYFLPFDEISKHWKISEDGGRKSIPYSAFDKGLLVKSKQGVMIHYLKTLDIYLNSME
ncbi:MAG: Holliday junction resolvase RecU [Clostridiales bacterium]|jgi:recombination protein U|nr:Holliday junction resolvase RecU [Clostridiales bacterium]